MKKHEIKWIDAVIGVLIFIVIVCGYLLIARFNPKLPSPLKTATNTSADYDGDSSGGNSAASERARRYGEDITSEEWANMTEEEQQLAQESAENARAVDYIRGIASANNADSNTKVTPYDGSVIVKNEDFSDSVRDLLYTEDSSYKQLNYELIAKFADSEGIDRGAVEAVGNTFASDDYGIAHYTYMGADKVFRVYFTTDLSTGNPVGFSEVYVDEK